MKTSDDVSSIQPDLNEPPIPQGMYEDKPRGPIGKLIMVFLGCVVIFLVGMWLYVFTGLAKRDHPDTLASTAFPTQAEVVCADAKAAFDEIPLLAETDDIIERADLIDEGIAILSAQLVELKAMAPDDGSEDAELIQQWFGDWDTHLEDRQIYADELRKPESTIFTPFLEQIVENRQVSDRLDAFAEVNSMLSCVHPTDL